MGRKKNKRNKPAKNKQVIPVDAEGIREYAASRARARGRAMVLSQIRRPLVLPVLHHIETDGQAHE